jgi:6-phosphogluconolactonase
MTRSVDLEVLSDPVALARRAADWLLDLVLRTDGLFAVGLSGGGTPQTLYELLATPPYRDALPFERIHWFWGDERFVPPSDQRSNFRMVWEALLSHVPVPPENIHPIPTAGADANEGAQTYEAELKAFYGEDRLDPARPLFNALFLGLGPDGHTASLFPGGTALARTAQWAVGAEGPDREARITLTYPVLESARAAAFLVAGAQKRDILARLLAGDVELPAGRLRPLGALRVFADAPAAGPDAPS